MVSRAFQRFVSALSNDLVTRAAHGHAQRGALFRLALLFVPRKTRRGGAGDRAALGGDLHSSQLGKLCAYNLRGRAREDGMGCVEISGPRSWTVDPPPSPPRGVHGVNVSRYGLHNCFPFELAGGSLAPSLARPITTTERTLPFVAVRPRPSWSQTR